MGNGYCSCGKAGEPQTPFSSRISKLSLNDVPLSVSMTFLSLYIFVPLLAARRPLQSEKIHNRYWILEFGARWALVIGALGLLGVGH